MCSLVDMTVIWRKNLLNSDICPHLSFTFLIHVTKVYKFVIFICCFVVCLVFHFCWVFLRDYDSAGAMMNGCINNAGAIQGHAGHKKDLWFSFLEFLYQWNIFLIKRGPSKDKRQVNDLCFSSEFILDFYVNYVR